MRFRVSVVLSVLALLVAAPASAGDAADASDSGPGTYVELDVGAVWIDAPAPDGLAANLLEAGTLRVPTDLSQDFDFEDWGSGFDALLGFDAPLLSGWSVEIGGGYSKVDDDAEDSVTLGQSANGFPLYTSVQNVNGLISLGYFAGPGETVNTDFDGEVRFWEVSLGVAKPVEILGVDSRIRVGMLGGSLDQDYSIEHVATGMAGQPELGNGLHNLDTELENLFVGGYLGVSFAARRESGLGAEIGFETALLYNSADLDAMQEYRGALFYDPAAGSPLACSPLCLVKTHERDKAERFGARPRIHGKLDWDFGRLIVGVSGSFTYWSFAPQVVNPEAPPGHQGIFAQYGRSHISGDDMMVATVGVSVTVPFGRD